MRDYIARKTGKRERVFTRAALVLANIVGATERVGYDGGPADEWPRRCDADNGLRCFRPHGHADHHVF